ncbi:MAG: YqgE/AlgH family protein [Ilumatobacteraceae bacterium]
MLDGPSTRGRLLVATPPLGDPNFDRSVVYVLEHSSAGAVGLILNRTGTVSGQFDPATLHDVPMALDDVDATLAVLEAWQPLLAPPRRMFVGGPVGDDSLIAVASGVGRSSETWGALTGSIGTVDLTVAPDEAAEQIERVRIFRGYAGWAPGQLDAEVDAGAWMVFDATDDDVFTPRPDQLWRDVVRRQGGSLAWIADAPDDIAAN